MCCCSMLLNDLITRMDLTPSYGRLVTVVMIIATIIFNLALSTTSLSSCIHHSPWVLRIKRRPCPCPCPVCWSTLHTICMHNHNYSSAFASHGRCALRHTLKKSNAPPHSTTGAVIAWFLQL